MQQDGRPAEVVSFRYIDTTDAEEQDELRVASAARRRFLLLFDKSFTDLAGPARSRRAAGDFVRRRLAPSDLAAVATFDVNNGIRVVANFTEDRALLSHAIATLGFRACRASPTRSGSRPTSRSPTCRRPRRCRKRRCRRSSSTASRAPP